MLPGKTPRAKLLSTPPRRFSADAASTELGKPFHRQAHTTRTGASTSFASRGDAAPVRRVNDPWRSYSVSGLSQTRSLRRKQRARCQSPSSLPVQSSPCGSPRLLRSASQPLVLSELHDGGVATRAHCPASAAACPVTAAATSSPASALSGKPPACSATVRLLLPCATLSLLAPARPMPQRSRRAVFSPLFSPLLFHAESLAEKQTNFGVPTSTLPPGPCSCTSLLPGGARHSVVTGRHSDGARESPLGDGLGFLTHGRGGDAGWH